MLDLAEQKHRDTATKNSGPWVEKAATLDKNDAIAATPKNKELIERTNVDIKYKYKSPYVNDKDTLNGALKFDASNANRLK